jgi:hypothetical protein
MQRGAVRATVGGIGLDIPLGVFSANGNVRFDGAQLLTVPSGLRETSGPTELAAGAIADLSDLYRSGTAILGRQRSIARITSNQAAAGTSFADVAGLSIALKASTNYVVMFSGTWQTSNVASTFNVTRAYSGSLAQSNGNTGFIGLNAGTAANLVDLQTIANLLTAGAINTAYSCMFFDIVLTGSAGNLTIQTKRSATAGAQLNASSAVTAMEF